ncbi:carboxy terminal-processing peptidase [Sulfuritalea sp.]|uniref:carboxy terminal-processing peptidase n=1 Tax=Sulfuritalea sp. TaxID=2480090 RepID=UPI00286E50C4|nr:carboxy terminal-processing peptidase [Sulfuritalea sp.]
MKKVLPWIAFALMTTAQAASFDPGRSPPPELRPSQQQAQAAHLAAEVLSRYHYKTMPLDDALSERILAHYLKSLDAEKLFFVQTDIDQLARFRTVLDDAIIDEDLGAPFAIFNLYAQRVSERFSYARGLLKEGFDFRQKEDYQYARDKEPWLKSEAEMREQWRKRVKNDWLRLKLAGKDDKAIVATLEKRYDNALKRIGRTTGKDAFEAFMNAYTMAIEPHTNYMGPRAAEDFDISMKLSLVGIGAALMEKDDYVTIRDLVPGGPAALSGQLKSGDRILGVAQGSGGAMTDILGWRLDDTVALIRGAADSIVHLDVLPADAGPDGKHKRVSLVRKRIRLEDQAAKKTILPVTDGKVTRQVGVISLPGFYEDFDARQKGDRDFKSATRDVARLLDELKKARVDSVLIDLRNNGGGSLKEAIELTGLFIDQGPVVQQRDARGRITIERDAKAGAAWDGPLGVMINRASASASEIFAAAIQDYGRGLVIGEPSFGKGTVQAMINLDDVARNDKQKYGELKLTVAQFFRINGDATQLRGVKPDIALPTMTDAESFGEASYDNALPWIQVKALDYSPAGDVKTRLPDLLKRHEVRVSKDKEFRFLQEDIAELNLQRKKKRVSLNEAERRKDRDVQEARLASRDAQEPGPKKNKVVRDDGLQAGERDLAKDLADEKADDKAKDVLLNEAARILGDEVNLLKPRTGFAVRAPRNAAQLGVQ